MSYKHTIRSFCVIKESKFLTCPECKARNLIKPYSKTTTKHLVAQSCYKCHETLFKVTFVSDTPITHK